MNINNTNNTFKMSVTIGSTKHLFVGAVGTSDEDVVRIEIQGLVSKAIRKGQTARHSDGWKEWIDFREVRSDGDYEWHADGERVLVQRVHIKLAPDGTRTEFLLPPVFRTPA